MSRSNRDALSELCSPFLKVGTAVLIAVIASRLFPKANIGHLNNYRSVLISYLEANSVVLMV